MTTPKLTYVSGDFATLREELVAYVQSNFPEWTDFNNSNTGMALIDLFSLVGDMLLYYMNFNTNEGFLPTAKLRHNVANIVKKLGYRLSSNQPAEVQITFSIPQAKAVDIVIPKGTIIKTDEADPARFEIMEDEKILAAGLTSTILTAIQGQTITDDTIGISNGRANQQMVLNESPVIDGTITVMFEGDGEEWTEVLNFVDSTSGDRHFITRQLPDGRTQVVFGDGLNGMMPQPDSAALATYRIGGGAFANNIAANKITVLEGVLYDKNGVAQSVTVTNSASPYGGRDEESIQHAKMYAPRAYKARETSINREDFETNCELYPGVARALALTANEDNSIPLNNEYLYIVPEDGGTPSNQMLEDIEDYLKAERPYAATLSVSAFPAQYVSFDLTIQVKAKVNYLAESVRNAVETTLKETYNFEALDDDGKYILDFGKSITREEIIGIIQNVEGVQHCKLPAPAADVTVAFNKIAKVGTIAVSLI